MPTITLTPIACTQSAGWRTLYHYATSSTPQQLIFTFAANSTLAGAGINITNISIRGVARNSNTVTKELQLGIKTGTGVSATAWASYSGTSLIDEGFTAVGASNGSDYKTVNFTRAFNASRNPTLFNALTGYIQQRFAAGSLLYLGVVQPTASRSIQVDCTLASWQLIVTYELLGNIPTNNVTSAVLGSTTITTTINRVLASSTTTLTYKIGSTTIKTTSLGTSTAASYTPPTSLGSYFPTSLSATLKIIAETFVSGVSYGTVESSVVLTLPDAAAPTCSVSATPTWASGVTSTGKLSVFVQGKGGAIFTLSGSGNYGASIAGYMLTIEGATYTGQSITHLPFASSGIVAYTYIVTDTRGLQRSYTGTLTVLAWREPQVSSFEIVRVNTSGVEAIDGTRVKYTFTASVSSLLQSGTQKNSIRYRVDYKEAAATSWTTGTLYAATGLTTTETSTLTGFDDMTGYDFRLAVLDIYATSYVYAEIATKEQLLDFDESAGSIGFGGDAPTSSDDVGFRFYKKTNFAAGLTDAAGQGICGAKLMVNQYNTTAVSAATGTLITLYSWTATETGLYAINTSVEWASKSGGVRLLTIQAGTATLAGSRLPITAAGAVDQSVAGFAYVSAGASINVLGWQNTGAALNYQNLAVQIVKIGV